MYHLKVRNEVSRIEAQKSEFCHSLNEPIEATLFLGPTGGGKTSLIEFLLSIPLTIKVKYSNPYLESITNDIGNGPNSKTRTIGVYPATISNTLQTVEQAIPFGAIGANIVFTNLYIDTPGFSDTYGEYTEIKNYFAIENILQCKKIKGFNIALILPKSALFYETNRNTDFVNFIKSINNFIPKFGSTKWMNEAFIVVTKTETRTTTTDVIKALDAAIEENNLDTHQREFFENIITNKKISIFPLPAQPYQIGATFHNNESYASIIELIRQSAYIPLEKQDFKQFNLSLNLDGEILKDISTAKKEIHHQINTIISAIKSYQERIVVSLPKNPFHDNNFLKQKKILDHYLTNLEKFCISPEESFYTDTMDHFQSTKELINNFCELDYSIKFMKNFTKFNDFLININDIKNEITAMLRAVMATYNWKICTINSYKTLFLSFKQDSNNQKKSIDTLLQNNANASDLFENNMDKKTILTQLIDKCSISKEENKEILELTSLNENNVLNKFAEFIAGNNQLQYHSCKITGNAPSISQIAFDDDSLNQCEEIAIYGRYGLKIDKSIEIELRGKNLVLIAPVIKVIEDQKIILSGKTTREHSVLQANEEHEGQAGETGESSGSFFAYSYHKLGDKLTIYAEGAKGGDGQDGGKGKDGKKGISDDGYNLQSSYSDVAYSKKFLHDQPEGVTYNWYKVTRYSDNGKPGTPGKNGRSGGEGGKGGVSGQVNFKVLNPNGLEKFDPITNNGLSGKNGASGEGGKGGEHGDAIQGIWHYSECTPIFFFCGLWAPYGYWEENHEPSSRLSHQSPALNGQCGKTIPFHLSNSPIRKYEIRQDKHKADYLDFILDQENNNALDFAFDLFKTNNFETCGNSLDPYDCF